MNDDLWAEYRVECAMREMLALPVVSLIEFSDMRDWTDRVEEADDENWITRPEPPPYAPLAAQRGG